MLHRASLLCLALFAAFVSGSCRLDSKLQGVHTVTYKIIGTGAFLSNQLSCSLDHTPGPNYGTSQDRFEGQSLPFVKQYTINFTNAGGAYLNGSVSARTDGSQGSLSIEVLIDGVRQVFEEHLTDGMGRVSFGFSTQAL